MPLESYTFDTERSESFANFRRAHYEGDAGCQPAEADLLMAQLSPRFGFYCRAGNRHLNFLLRSAGRVLGHVTAMLNTELTDHDGTPVGSVGFFECIEDESVAATLLAAATDWLRGEGGVRRIWGPLNFDIWHTYRFMTRGFDEQPFYGEPRNKPWYPTFFESFGFRVRQRWNSLEVSGRTALEASIAGSAHKYRRLIEEGYVFRPLNSSDAADITRLHVAESWGCRDFLGYTQISEAEYRGLFAIHAARLDMTLVSLVIDPQGEVVGLGAAFPDCTNSVKGPQTTPGRRAVFYMVAASPLESTRGHGVGGAIYNYTVRRSLESGHDIMVFAMLAEDSVARYLIGEPMRSAQREYTLYQLGE